MGNRYTGRDMRPSSECFGGETHAAMGSAVPSVPPRFATPCMRDLARAALELLQHVGAGAQSEGERRPGASRAHPDVSSTKNCPCGVGVEGLPTIAANDLTKRARR